MGRRGEAGGEGEEKSDEGAVRRHAAAGRRPAGVDVDASQVFAASADVITDGAMRRASRTVLL